MQRDGRPALEDPVVRQRLAEIAGYVATQEWAVARMLTAIHKSQDAKVISEMLMTKLYGSNVQQMIAKLALDLIAGRGPARARRATRSRWASSLSRTRAGSRSTCSRSALTIAGGTSNVQRNIIGERVLGLPRDQRPS